MKSPLVLGFNGSPYQECRTQTMLTGALDEAAAFGARVQSVHIYTETEQVFFDGQRFDVEPKLRRVLIRKLPPKLKNLLKLVRRADALIFASPVYWGGPTPQLVNFLSYFTIFEGPLKKKTYDLTDKVFGLIAVHEEDGGQSTCEAIARTLLTQGMNAAPFGVFYSNKRMAVFSEGKWQATDHRLVGANVVRNLQGKRAFRSVDQLDKKKRKLRIA